MKTFFTMLALITVFVVAYIFMDRRDTEKYGGFVLPKGSLEPGTTQSGEIIE